MIRIHILRGVSGFGFREGVVCLDVFDTAVIEVVAVRGGELALYQKQIVDVKWILCIRLLVIKDADDGSDDCSDDC